jgi:5-methylcytosine-specific restriction endonuclease McrA
MVRGDHEEEIRQLERRPTKSRHRTGEPREHRRGGSHPDLRAVVDALGGSTLTRDQYIMHGRFSPVPMTRAFGSWNGALRAAGLVPSFDPVQTSDDVCFEAIETAWRHLGRQPKQAELAPPIVKVSGVAVTRRFGSWRRALEAFVAYVNTTSTSAESTAATPRLPERGSDGHACDTVSDERQSTPRIAGWRLRFLVMRRDAFRCVKCGRSPATHHGLALVIDHVIPWSKGGQTVFENLRTLCEECNGGRGNLSCEPG